MPDPDSPIFATFRKPFSEQVAAFRLRLGNLVPTARWDDIRLSAHDRSFMVAGATKADLLADLAAAVDRAIAEGTGFEAFKRDFRGIVERHGWHGWTGEGTEEGENWRMRTIYRTNMRTSYMAGRYAQLTRGGFKYWVYRHGGSREPRPQHLAWDGLILPAEHPFWSTHYPPNGWGCSCRVFGARTIAGAKRRGGDPSIKLQKGWDKLDPRTGTPPGIGEGWDYAPGATTASAIDAMTRKTVKWEYVLAKEFMDELPDEVVDDFATGYRALPSLRDSVRRFADAVVDDARADPSDQFRTLGRLTSQQVANTGKKGFETAGFDFTIDRDAIRHIARAHGDAAREALRGQRAVTTKDIARLASLLDRNVEILDGGPALSPGTRRILFRIPMANGETWNVAWEARRRRRMLLLKTFFINSRN